VQTEPQEPYPQHSATYRPDKLTCLTLVSLSSLMYCYTPVHLQVAKEKIVSTAPHAPQAPQCACLSQVGVVFLPKTLPLVL